MAVFNYPDFDRAVPDIPEMQRSYLRDGYAEQRFRDAVHDIIRECGNRLIAQGIALELVREETEKPS